MAEEYSTSLLDAMDRLWFHQIILFSQSFPNKTLENPLPIQDSLMPQEVAPERTPAQHVCEKQEGNEKESPTRLSCFDSPKQLSHPCQILQNWIEGSEMHQSTFQESPSNISPKGRSTTLSCSDSPKRLSHPCRILQNCNTSEGSETFQESPSNISPKERSTRLEDNEDSRNPIKQVDSKAMSLGELELEEVKGFMDLGFIFNKEDINKKMIRVIPGLQRLDQDSEDEDEEKREIVRPYLSEAWLIKRPDSPLLNLRIPTRISAASDMKKHLRCWAKTVATVVHQESCY